MTNNQFIIIKGEPKALKIEKIYLDNRGYAVKFIDGRIFYRYNPADVVILQNAVWHDPKHCIVYINGCKKYNITDLLSFNHGKQTHWRIKFSNGFTKDYLHGSIIVKESCLEDRIANNTFEYLKQISQVNELGKSEESAGILSSIYNNIDFIDDETAAATYLSPQKYKPHTYRTPNLIYPFGCNANQKKAVIAAFENQISIIQGPPGTGKTQTILNIVANIILQGKNVIIVSNNNSATANVLEKMKKYGLDFIIAPLGKKENKENFIANQPPVPDELKSWGITYAEKDKKEKDIKSTLIKLDKAFILQESLSSDKQELTTVTLEQQHFLKDYQINPDLYSLTRKVKAKKLMRLWMYYHTSAENNEHQNAGVLKKITHNIKWRWMNFSMKYLYGIEPPADIHDLQPTIIQLQALYYKTRLQELTSSIERTEKKLNSYNTSELLNKLVSSSLTLLKGALHRKYNNKKRSLISSVKEIVSDSYKFCKEYPVILSTTFSARITIPNQIYDYVIMDEASQVSIDTGTLALTCAKNAVIVGDTLQLPNVTTHDDILKYDAIFKEFNVSKDYNCVTNSFLQSICNIISSAPQTLLREHYRCHPTIINFCNQRFYGGQLLIMTENSDKKDVMLAIKTAPGKHIRNHYNQREIDVVKEEVLPTINSIADAGIITPYNSQVNEFLKQIPDIETATIHKYQGREKDTIIMSVVDDQITEFSDDSNLINVAVSRAKNHFIIVVSGNEQERKGCIEDLINYIEYNNMTVKESKINSIFDYLYSQYTNERIAFLKAHKKISEYDSENLTYTLLLNILKKHIEFRHLSVLCHTPIRVILKDWSLLSESERKYVSHYGTHIDFLIINRVTKKPVLAIETDGYSYHNNETEQHQRDIMKDHILEVYNIPILRLKTNESGEENKILKYLRSSSTN